MNAHDFIIKAIDKLVLDFPMIKCRYEFDGMDDTHIIEITPDEFYNFDDRIREVERQIIFDFIERFPSEGLYFVTDKFIFPIQTPIYCKEGSKFGLLDRFIVVTGIGSPIFYDDFEIDTSFSFTPVLNPHQSVLVNGSPDLSGIDSKYTTEISETCYAIAA